MQEQENSNRFDCQFKTKTETPDDGELGKPWVFKLCPCLGTVESMQHCQGIYLPVKYWIIVCDKLQQRAHFGLENQLMAALNYTTTGRLVSSPIIVCKSESKEFGLTSLSESCKGPTLGDKFLGHLQGPVCYWIVD